RLQPTLRLLFCYPASLCPHSSPFFFQADVHHLTLPSFPTRRSSDLRPRLLERRVHRLARAPVGDRPPRRLRRDRAGRADRDRHRSEEHTSELQSPDHLVCRLLLEKKNIHYWKID